MKEINSKRGIACKILLKYNETYILQKREKEGRSFRQFATPSPLWEQGKSLSHPILYLFNC
jgi:hypothetical protein